MIIKDLQSLQRSLSGAHMTMIGAVVSKVICARIDGTRFWAEIVAVVFTID